MRADLRRESAMYRLLVVVRVRHAPPHAELWLIHRCIASRNRAPDEIARQIGHDSSVLSCPDMSETMSVTVAEAARRLGVTERTIWRRLRSGAMRAHREDRRVLVELPAHAVAEAGLAYRATTTQSDWDPGPWPYTPEIVERHRRAVLARRRAAAAEMDRLAALSGPDPDGLSAVDYLRADRDGVEITDAPRRP